MSHMQNKIKTQQKTILVAMGGNLESEIGPPHVTLGYAMASLRSMTNSLLLKSKYFVTPCFPVGYGPDYVNAAASFQFQGESQELLAILHRIEANFGRLRSQRWGGRVLDLDLLAFGMKLHQRSRFMRRGVTNRCLNKFLKPRKS